MYDPPPELEGWSNLGSLSGELCWAPCYLVMGMLALCGQSGGFTWSTTTPGCLPTSHRMEKSHQSASPDQAPTGTAGHTPYASHFTVLLASGLPDAGCGCTPKVPECPLCADSICECPGPAAEWCQAILSALIPGSGYQASPNCSAVKSCLDLRYVRHPQKWTWKFSMLINTYNLLCSTETGH